MKSIAVFLFVLFYYVSADTSIEGSHVYNVWPKTKQDFKILASLETRIPGLDVWQRAHVEGREGRILVPKTGLKKFETILNLKKIKYEVFIEDVEKVLKNEVQQQKIARLQRGKEKISFTAYNRHNEINAYLDSLALKYPKMVTVETAARTPQGREVKMIKISSTQWSDPRKPVIIVDAGIHAREWIAPSVALYMIEKLVENVTESDVVNNIDWLIFPQLNPDGYEYSHTNNRMWRKTRNTVASSSCPGVDGNRNFDFMWMSSGSSSNPCADNYAGPRAFSEVETQALRDQMSKYKARAKLYLAIHSYGSYFLYPYGYDGSLPPNYPELHMVGLKVAKAIDALKAPGAKNYLVGNSATALNYAAAGASDDYAIAVGKIDLAFTLELPGGGNVGFDLPPSKIRQVVTESWAGILVLARHVLEKYGMN